MCWIDEMKRQERETEEYQKHGHLGYLDHQIKPVVFCTVLGCGKPTIGPSSDLCKAHWAEINNEIDKE